VIRKLSTSLLALVAIVSAVSVVCQAQPQTLLTRHVREAVLNGAAQPLGRLPATQSLHFDIVLALRNQPALETSWTSSTILPAPPTGSSLRCRSLPRDLAPVRKTMTP